MKVEISGFKTREAAEEFTKWLNAHQQEHSLKEWWGQPAIPGLVLHDIGRVPIIDQHATQSLVYDKDVVEIVVRN